MKSEYNINIKWTYFPLHTYITEEGSTVEQLFAGRNVNIEAARAHIESAMHGESLPFTPGRSMVYNSRRSQELLKWAKSRGKETAMHKELNSAYYIDHINIGKVDVLAPLADKVGLSAGEATAMLADGSYKAEVDADWARCQKLGINGIPLFLAGDQMVSGAQPYEVLAQLVEHAGAVKQSVDKAGTQEATV